MIRAVLFDLYGTLIRLERDSRPYSRLAKLIAPEGLREVLERARRSPTESVSDLAAQLDCGSLPELPALDADLQLDVASARVLPGAVETLQRLRERGLKLALVSNLAKPYCVPAFALGLSDFFQAMLFSCDEGVTKPNPEIYHRALARLGVQPHEALMVGDSPRSDVAGAQGAGLYAELVPGDHATTGDADQLARMIFARLDALAAAEDPPSTQSMKTDEIVAETPADVETLDFDSLWNYADPAATERMFRGVLSVVRKSPDPEQLPQLLSQIARTQILQRRFDEGLKTLDEADDHLSDATPTAALRCLLERGRAYNDLRQTSEARKAFESVFHRAAERGLTWLAVDAAHMLGVMEPYDDATEWNRAALSLAGVSDDPRARRWAPTLALNLGLALLELGCYEDSGPAFEDALALAEKAGNAERSRLARLCFGKNQRLLGETDNALALQETLLLELRAAGDHEGYAHEEIAECLLALDRADDARPYFARAYSLLSTFPWYPPNQPERLERLRTLGESG